MNDLSNMIADFLQQNKSESNKSNHKSITQVTVQATDNSKGNRSNLGNQEKLSNEAMVLMLTHTSQESGLTTKQLWSFLDYSDIDNLQHHLIDQTTLTAYAKSWARYPKTVPICNTLPFPAIEERKLIKCRYCQHFAVDKIGDGSGAGTCMIKAQASIKGLVWLNSEKFCNEYKSKQYNGIGNKSDNINCPGSIK